MYSKFYKNKVISSIIFLVTILYSGHALQTILPKLEYMLVLVFILVLYPFLKQLTVQKVNIYFSAPYLFLIMLIMTSFAHYFSGIKYYSSIFLLLFAAFGITIVYPFHKVIHVFLNTMTVITAISILGYILLNSTEYLEYLPRLFNTNDIEYGIGIVYNYIVSIPERNCGMFWEPGLFATFLVFSIIFELIFKQGEISKIRLILFSVGIFTANSSAGYLLWVACLILALTIGKKFTKYQKPQVKILISILFAASLFLLLNLDTIIRKTSLIENEYIVKLLSENVAESSRVLALEHNLRIFISNPIFGAGITSVNEQMKHVADTSTSTFLLSVFGILGVLYTLLFIYGVWKIKNINGFSKITLIGIILAIINKEPHQSNLFTWCLLFYLLKGTSHPKTNMHQKIPRTYKWLKPVIRGIHE